MKKARFTESQIVAIFKEADVGLPVGEVIRKHGITLLLLTQNSKKRGKRVGTAKGQRPLRKESLPIGCQASVASSSRPSQ